MKNITNLAQWMVYKRPQYGRILNMISHKHKFIFIHINKTGGSSIERAIDPSIPTHNSKTNRVCPSAAVGNTYHKGKHFPARKMWANHPDCFDLYFKFTFVRNPWATEAKDIEYFGYKFES